MDGIAIPKLSVMLAFLLENLSLNASSVVLQKIGVKRLSGDGTSGQSIKIYEIQWSETPNGTNILGTGTSLLRVHEGHPL